MKHSTLDNKHQDIIPLLTLRNTNHLEHQSTLKTQSQLGLSINQLMMIHIRKLTIQPLLRMVEIYLFQKQKSVFILMKA